MTRIFIVFGITLGLLGLARVAPAQEVGGYLSLGGMHDGSTGKQIETFGDGVIYKTPRLDGLFATFGASISLRKSFGVGGEISWRPSLQDYAGIPYRPTLYSFDAIYKPAGLTSKRFVPELRAGLGGMRLTFFPANDCGQIAACPSANHFQTHLGVAGRWYWTEHFFLRPAIDVHHVNNLAEFGSDWIPQYSVGIGYSIGRE